MSCWKIVSNRTCIWVKSLQSIKDWLLKVRFEIVIIVIAFKLMELTLKEIFSALAIIQPDPYIVWEALTEAYPEGHFNGVIEDEYGAFCDEDMLNDLQE